MFEVEARIRTAPEDDLDSRHAFVMRGLQSARIISKELSVARPEFGSELSALVDIDGFSVNDWSGQIQYVFRSPKYSGDEALFDDFVVVRSSDASLANYAADKLIEMGGWYRCEVITSRALARKDYDKAIDRGAPDFNGRSSIARFWPVAYYDELLCNRAFGLSPEEACKDLLKIGIDARVMNIGGLKLSNPFFESSVSRLEDFDHTVRKALASN